MPDYAFTFQSITAAQGSRNILDRRGIENWILRSPKSLSDLGCGYLVKVRGQNGPRAAAVLRAWGAPFVRVYALFPDGRIEAAAL
jgi:hypothetical protein